MLPVDAKITAISEFPVPTTKRELRCFIGLAGYYRGFGCNFASIVSPLTDLLSPTKDLVCDAKCELAFQTTKAILSSSPVLLAPNFAVLFKLEVDASLRRGVILSWPMSFHVCLRVLTARLSS